MERLGITCLGSAVNNRFLNVWLSTILKMVTDHKLLFLVELLLKLFEWHHKKQIAGKKKFEKMT